MMISYKSLAGVEIQHFQDTIYFWMPNGVYSLKAKTLHCHGEYHGVREVEFWLVDLINGHVKRHTEIFGEALDDWELINRYVSGTGACDCVRGCMVYGPELTYKCNNADNRFILQKMVIKGETVLPKTEEAVSGKADKLNCIVTYRGYV